MVNSWRHCFKSSLTNFQDPSTDSESNAEEMVSAAKEHRLGYSRVGIEYLLNPMDEDDVVAGIDLQFQAIFIASLEDVEINNDGFLKTVRTKCSLLYRSISEVWLWPNVSWIAKAS